MNIYALSGLAQGLASGVNQAVERKKEIEEAERLRKIREAREDEIRAENRDWEVMQEGARQEAQAARDTAEWEKRKEEIGLMFENQKELLGERARLFPRRGGGRGRPPRIPSSILDEQLKYHDILPGALDQHEQDITSALGGIKKADEVDSVKQGLYDDLSKRIEDLNYNAKAGYISPSDYEYAANRILDLRETIDGYTFDPSSVPPTWGSRAYDYFNEAKELFPYTPAGLLMSAPAKAAQKISDYLPSLTGGPPILNTMDLAPPVQISIDEGGNTVTMDPRRAVRGSR